MDELIITAACDCLTTWPSNPHMPARGDTEPLADQFVSAFDAGASILHHHCVVHHDDATGRPRIDLDGWRRTTDILRERAPGALMHYGIAGIMPPDKRVLMEEQRPELMSTHTEPHDTHFAPDPSGRRMDIYTTYPRELLLEVARDSLELGTKIESECFTTGSYWTMQFLMDEDLLPEPRWATIFLGWPGGTWTPPTADALHYMVRHLPPGTNWNLSIMDPVASWELIPLAIEMGGHVRVGWEDNPYLPNGEIAADNGRLVEIVVSLATSLGREVASPARAREIVGVPASVPSPTA
jgi:3-keto-5-aminohexanoate cleavage enzyme